jgi:hypothetical protein
MELQSDFRDLLASFAAAGVEDLVVGGYALAFHGAPRHTGVLDVLVRPSRENARRIMTALDAFGFGDLGLTEDDVTDPENVVHKRATGRTRDLADLEDLGEREG